MKKLSKNLFKKFESNQIVHINKVLGGRSSDTGTCPTDYTSSGGNPDCTTEECMDIVMTDVSYDTPVPAQK